MKISIGYKKIHGPWGGGNSFSIQLFDYLKKNNINVVNDLNDEDIDLILLTEPRRYNRAASFNHLDVLNYIKNKNKETIVVHRINECDERKNSKGLNEFLINVSNLADHTVFISDWLKKLYLEAGFKDKNNSIIRNGANKEIFNFKESKTLNKKVKIVTHHWGNDLNKGFDIYQRIDKLLDDKKFSSKFDFTFIGNIPDKLTFKNTNIVKPLFGRELGNELRKFDIYITGSKYEPAGMHHIEGAMSGLPILYLNSGGVTEYCKNYGLEYNRENIENKLNEIVADYSLYFNKLKKYEFTGKAMSKAYFDLFKNLMSDKKNLIENRTTRNIDNFKFKNQYKIYKYYFYY